MPAVEALQICAYQPTIRYGDRPLRRSAVTEVDKSRVRSIVVELLCGEPRKRLRRGGQYYPHDVSVQTQIGASQLGGDARSRTDLNCHQGRS